MVLGVPILKHFRVQGKADDLHLLIVLVDFLSQYN